MPLKKYLNILITIVVTITLQTCKPDDGPKPCNSTTTYHYLSADQLSKTPYFTNPAFDTISFASDRGDTVTFALKKIDTTYYIEDTNINPNRICSYWQYHQNIIATYNTIKGSGSFMVKQILKDADNNDIVMISLNNSLLYYHDYWIGQLDHPGYKDLLILNNNSYQRIYKITLNETNSYFVVSKDFGLIQLVANQIVYTRF